MLALDNPSASTIPLSVAQRAVQRLAMISFLPLQSGVQTIHDRFKAWSSHNRHDGAAVSVCRCIAGVGEDHELAAVCLKLLSGVTGSRHSLQTETQRHVPLVYADTTHAQFVTCSDSSSDGHIYRLPTRSDICCFRGPLVMCGKCDAPIFSLLSAYSRRPRSCPLPVEVATSVLQMAPRGCPFSERTPEQNAGRFARRIRGRSYGDPLCNASSRSVSEARWRHRQGKEATGSMAGVDRYRNSATNGLETPTINLRRLGTLRCRVLVAVGSGHVSFHLLRRLASASCL